MSQQIVDSDCGTNPQYSRAGKVREREQGPSLFTTLTLPPLPFCPSDPVSLFVCGARESVCVCAALCAFHVVSPRDLWLCVLP